MSELVTERHGDVIEATVGRTTARLTPTKAAEQAERLAFLALEPVECDTPICRRNATSPDGYCDPCRTGDPE